MIASSTIYVVTGGVVETTFLLGMFFFLSTAFLNSFNNIMDTRSDRLTKQNFPLPNGLVTVKQAALFSAGLFSAAFFVATAGSTRFATTSYILLFNLLLAFLYSAPVIRLKRYPIVKATVLIAHTVFLPMAAAATAVNRDITSHLPVAAPVYLMGLAIHTIQDIGDVAGDRLVGDKTFPILLGVRRSLVIVLALLLGAGVSAWFVSDSLRFPVMFGLVSMGLLVSTLFLHPGRWKQVFWGCSFLSFFVLMLLLVETFR
ncbi:MAG: UbiA family prenyltransferase [Candidatus Caldarchaeum sp.]|nr:UbiA family prenyltransferase [Candidatus Caldarchaeum sp.]MCX8201701.1 UbiA family prenyltransferase [Candidatus Caldarchaeum sp.]MDW8434631.1 UbiA family prenyltransferase [Candidatus Caldarchaeum sp.]